MQKVKLPTLITEPRAVYLMKVCVCPCVRVIGSPLRRAEGDAQLPWPGLG